jgi:site-specific recombinase XerD
VDTLAERAQKDKPFTHAFSPHCVRHTFAIQHINVGTDVKLACDFFPQWWMVKIGQSVIGLS